MRFDLCSACVYFRPSLKTYEKCSPKHCTNPYYLEWFGENVGGFP